MKKIILIHLATIICIMNASSQSAGDSLQKSPTCFMIAHIPPKSVHKNISETFCVGEKVKVKLTNNQIINGPIENLSRDSVVTVDGTEIDIKSIKWISKSKKGPTSAIVGGLLMAGGAAILINLAGGSVTFDETPGHLLAGTMLITTGIIVMTSRSKFKMESGDQMMIKD